MTDQSVSVQPATQPFQFRGRLVRNVVIGLLFISLIPSLIIGLVTYFRTQQVLREQTTVQLGSIANNYIQQLNQVANTNLVILSEIQAYPYKNIFLPRLLKDQTDPDYGLGRDVFNDYLLNYMQTPSGQRFSMISIFDLKGNFLTSSNLDVSHEFMTGDPLYQELFGNDKSLLVTNPGGLFPGKSVMITSYTLMLNNQPAATLVGFAIETLPVSILQSARSVLASSRAYLISADGAFISDYPGSDSLLINNLPESQRVMISKLVSQSETGTGFEYANIANQAVFSYITKIPMIDSAFVLEIPADSVFSQVRSILPFVLLLVLAVLLISGLVVALSARRVVLPIVDLSRRAQDFASGDWSFRAKVNRNDEIGLLAYSFNKMLDELTGYYRSLETRVEEKTLQLRTASDIAQTAVSFANRNEIFESIPQLIVEKMNISYAAVYLFDMQHNRAVLFSNASKDASDDIPEKGLLISAAEDSLIGWSSLNKQARISDDLTMEKSLTNRSGILENSRSEITVPVMSTNALLGLIDLQSDQIDVFDQETVSIFNSFANQIAAGLRNIQVLENAQVDLRETTSLYQISRQLSQAHSSEEVETVISQYFGQSDLVSIFCKCEQDQIRLLNITDRNGTKSDQAFVGFAIPLAKGLMRLRDGNFIILEDLKSQSDLSNLAIYFEKRGCISLAVFPIFEAGELTHILALGSRASDPLSNLQLQPYRNFSEAIGTTLERISLLHQLSLRVQELSAIATVGEAASTASDLNELFEHLFTKLKSSLGDDIGFAVALNDQEHSRVNIPFYFDEEKIEFASYPYSNDLVSQTILTGNTILHRDANAIGLFSIDSPEKRVPTRSFLGIPLIVSGETVGALTLLNRRDANRFSETNLSLLNTLAPQIGTSIRNVELLESQRSAIQAYDKERFLLNALLKNIPDKVVIKNEEGRLIRVSDSFAYSFNITDPNSLIDQADPSINVENDVDADIEILRSGVPNLGQIEEAQSIDGKNNWFLTSKIPLTTQDGSANSLLKISRDITDLISTQHIAEHRSDQLVIAAEIARETSMGSLQLDEMLSRMVDLVKTRFGFYHCSVFLLDAIGQNAVLRESTGEAGAKMKGAGHRLAVGSSSIVGQTTSRMESVVVNDVTKEANYYPNPLLPETRAELGIPLKVGQKMLGALDVQSKQVDAFTQDDINILQIMADQLSVAIENADLYSKAQKTLDRHRLLHQVTSTSGQNITIEDAIRNAVQTVHLSMPTEQISFISTDHGNIASIQSYSGYAQSELSGLRLKISDSIFGSAAKNKKPILISDVTSQKSANPIGTNARSALSVPVVYANKIYGVINVESNEPGVIDESDQEIITTLADNLGSVIANIELYEQISLQVERQRQLYEITNKIRRSVDIETIMQTSLAEVCSALNIRKASIQLNTGTDAKITTFEEENNKEFGK